jgi:hypothetical protein
MRVVARRERSQQRVAVITPTDRQVARTNFKALTKTNSKQPKPNYLHHTTRGTSSYRRKLKHDTLPKLNLAGKIHELCAVLLLSTCNLVLVFFC